MGGPKSVIRAEAGASIRAPFCGASICITRSFLSIDLSTGIPQPSPLSAPSMVRTVASPVGPMKPVGFASTGIVELASTASLTSARRGHQRSGIPLVKGVDLLADRTRVPAPLVRTKRINPVTLATNRRSGKTGEDAITP